MKTTSLLRFAAFGLSTIVFRRRKAILGTIILTDKCNLQCRHCSVNNLTAVIHPYAHIRREMDLLYRKGIRILFFCGGEPLLWNDAGRGIRELVVEAKALGFLIVNVVTNGTLSADIPEADLVLLSLDGDPERHNFIRGETYSLIMQRIAEASTPNICFYMAINSFNKTTIRAVCETAARSIPQVRAVSFNFHTPYPGTEALALSVAEKQACCDEIAALMDEGFPIFNLRSAFPYIVRNTFPVPCRQCVVIEGGALSICGRCIDVPGLCEQCGYFFAAEYTLAFNGNIRVIIDMLQTYLKYV